ncbi:MAG: efflux RND transporter periplasmic adaptor subunit [candidate division Zixibacteria bacterium]|jgi:HlyD family secretion protein|nr:efflux RND transporter periplasmic adaptor subunit [candidate division Zixibacteria bacterium]
MSKRVLVYGLAIAIVIVGAYFLLHGFPGAAAVQYQFASVTRGTIEITVSATGTLSPVTTVEVGTQISGTIDTVFVDFNDPVTADQILAVLDTSLLKASVLDAEASLERAEAQLDQARADYTRNKALFEQKLISESTWLPFAINLKTQNAAVKSAQAALDRNRRNLEYAVIRSPIDGIVIGRNIESGQTVAASLSTPTLFVIARNLDRMEILVDVDESDIGDIKLGQRVRFEVAAYLNEEFSGTVTQIRLQPKTVSNVVTYTVVVEADNDRGLLLPGMTATAEFITSARADVLIIPAKALRFQPPAEELETYRARRDQERAGKVDSSAVDVSARRPGEAGRPIRQRPAEAGTVWYLDSLGRLAAAPLRTGLSDGSNTEVVASRILTEGMQIISGTQSEISTAQQSRSMQRPPMGPGMRPF